MRFAARLALVMLLALGLLLPRVSVMLAELTGAERVLLCDGTAMVVMVLDDEGRPVHVDHDDPCGMLVPAPVPLAGALPAFAAPALPAWITRGASLGSVMAGLPRLHLARAPPALA